MSEVLSGQQAEGQTVNSQPDFAYLRNLDVWRVLAEQTLNYPEKEAVVFGHKRLTYRKLTELAEHCAAGLYAHGMRTGDKLALLLPNWPEFVVAFFAAARIGVVVVPFNVRYRASELNFMLRDSGAKILITCAQFGNFDYIATLNELRPSLPALEHLVVVGQAAGGQHLVAWEGLLGEGAKASHLLPPVAINPAEDLALIAYTSGTTGTSKGAMLSHKALLFGALMTAEVMQTTSHDKFLATVPLFNIFGISPTMLAALGSGATLVLMDIFSPEETLGLVERERITVLHGVPTMFILELNYPNFNNFDTSSLRTGIIAAAPAPAEIIRRIRSLMGCEILSAYGLTETAPTLTITHFDDDAIIRAETVGRPLPGVEIKIVDDNNEALPFGQVGELVCRSPGLMRGYYNMPEATMTAFDAEGWFYSGDLATLAEDGVVRIVGRKKDLINRDGFKILPREVEELFYKHPKVQEVAVIGMPDPVLGERSFACIKLHDGVTATAEEMIEYIAPLLAEYKVPDVVLFVTHFPKTSSGKIKKMKLKQELTS